MRIDYSDEEDHPGQFALWDANCTRSLRGRRGQQELRELEAALLALSEKRLIRGALEDDEGGVCAIAAYGKRKGVDLSTFDPEYNSDEIGIAGGMPRLVAWKVVVVNDIVFDEGRWVMAEGPAGGVPYRFPESVWVPFTPEERYAGVLAWVQRQLDQPASSVAVDPVDGTWQEGPRA